MRNKNLHFTSAPITNFTFQPHTFRIGADEGLTVITGYLRITKELRDTIVRRRTRLQLGDPTALIATYDLECHKLGLYCIDTLDTQCKIYLQSSEEQALHKSLSCSVEKEYHDTPEHLLNLKRIKAHLPTLR